MTPEEVAKLLQEGKAIKKLCDDNEYKLVNGLLYDSDNNCFNSQLFLEDDDLYFEINEPFEITEPGVYKTRDGRKAFVAYKEENSFIGMVEDSHWHFAWNSTGRRATNATTSGDIVSKWEE